MTHGWEIEDTKQVAKGRLSENERRAAASILKVLENPRSDKALTMLFNFSSDPMIIGVEHWDFAENGQILPGVRHVIRSVLSMNEGKPVVNGPALAAQKRTLQQQ
ncbi:MAG: hypothetical protein DI626_06525 [Micavibrio aeruginosavorus]|uniref:Uncharacterized protein n=1 Tax=Micavibrio aeruginosavorus TaxID=349221 RepID=A0A2W4ZZS4_9BACT|nr:MAG: hypothetical protein DI626_06525 [Micavibrio aeruginosavorus]